MNFFLTIAVSLFLYFVAWYILSLILKRADIADIAWGIGFPFVCWSSIIISGFSITSLAVNILITLWGLRLAFHIFQRKTFGSEADREWQPLSERFCRLQRRSRNLLRREGRQMVLKSYSYRKFLQEFRSEFYGIEQ